MTTLHFYDNTYSIDGQIGIVPEDPAKPIAPHRHHFVEFVYQSRGSAVHSVDNRIYRLEHGDLLLINYHQTHEIPSVSANAAFINLLLKPAFVGQNLIQPENAFSLLALDDFEQFRQTVNRNNPHVRFSGEQRRTAEALLSSLIAESRQQLPGSDVMMHSALNLLLTMIFRKMALPMRSSSERINEVFLQELRERCDEKLTLDRLAEECHYSPAYFSRVFKQTSGVTLTEFLTRARMEKACELLECGSPRVEEIIPMTGYTDRTRFFRDFSRFTGMTPLQYRKSKM